MNNWKNSKRYMRSFGALYGNEKAVIQARRKKSLVPSEESEQIRLVNWCEDEEIRCYAIPNSRNNVGEGLRYKRQGASAGVPDLCFPYPKKGFGSLYIELKRISGGVTSPQQKEWLEWLNSHGQKAVVAKGFDEAKKIIEEYFDEE